MNGLARGFAPGNPITASAIGALPGVVTFGYIYADGVWIPNEGGGGGEGGGVVNGSHAPADNEPNPVDAVRTISYLEGWNGDAESGWSRLSALSLDATSIDFFTGRVALATSSFLYGVTPDSTWGAISCENGRLHVDANGAFSMLDTFAVSTVAGSIMGGFAGMYAAEPAADLTLNTVKMNRASARNATTLVLREASAWTTTKSAHPLFVSGTGLYSSAQPAAANVTDGRMVEALVDKAGNTLVMQGRPPVDARDSPSFTGGDNTPRGVIKATPGNLLALHLNNQDATPWFFALVDTNAAPGGSAPIVCAFKVPAGGTLTIGRDVLSQAGLNFATGIGWAWSTTLGTVTLAGSANTCMTACYV